MSRAAILAGVRRALGRDGPLEGEALAAIDQRLAQPRANLVPARGRLAEEERVALFARLAGEVGATTERLAADQVPTAIARYLAQQNLPAAAAIAPDPALDALPWSTAPMLALKRGPTQGDDLVGISRAFAAVAETGTLVMLSGPDSPTTLNFLSETHVVVLPVARLAGAYEEVWARLRAERDGIPRTVNLITGPSRTADIEQTIQRGAHGPRRLHILLVDDGG
jgi:L-lactate dehydrogenase complex protein LldG